MSSVENATTRFSSRVDNYVKYRPGYPPQILEVLARECGFHPAASVADIGSGTGIFTRILLENGNAVFGVEPNAEMRAAAEAQLADQPRFTSVDGTAEATTLSEHSVSFVTAAQAFHWFRPEPTRREFARILQPGGYLAVVWNERRVDSTPFLRAYENLLLTFGTDYAEVRRTDLDLARVRTFVGSAAVKQTLLENHQHFDWEGLVGRTLSSSYAPEPGHPNHPPMLARLRAIFEQHAADGIVSFDYDTHVYTALILSK